MQEVSGRLHSKIVISVEDDGALVFDGDLNKHPAQAKRGGGSCVVEGNKVLWGFLKV